MKIKKGESKIFPTAIYSKIDLFNGMFGRIDRIIEKDGAIYYSVDFDYKKEKKDLKDLKDKDDKNALFEYSFFNKNFINDMAYINTVHKYQGSENKYIILILPLGDITRRSNVPEIFVELSPNETCVTITEPSAINPIT